jgi:hypothetical protein
MEPEERPQFLAKAHNALREVGGYQSFIKERFERCLDLYLCPRIKRTPVCLFFTLLPNTIMSVLMMCFLWIETRGSRISHSQFT